MFVSCADRTVNDYVTDFKAELPQDLGDGMAMTDISIVDNYLQIDATTDESGLELSNPLVEMVLPTVAETLKAQFFDDSDMKDFMQACSDGGKGFRMVLKGTKSGKSVTLFEATPEEMNEKYPPRTKEK